ncbi:MAG TPA: AmmeMemoRadiSam system radical SAM enzyme [Bacteroidales bacterium]|nr:AmmeMemoRadiSam system radical SAM enzyme [Bacteroidales bacterium]HQG52932.1 AmmeMemoRadiSam system radical SAM enzyme [Bacteroidales bacterium]HQJ21026.1 AmmeMemoRadiSam system radical SAM enzyme [Bacteroidales bacterium]HRC89703.1 AmmeMemoRadiSam system radical SAM enzyme [Bacteroidales bacterium]
MFQRKSGEKIECYLCPHNCKLSEGKTGICGVRKNSSGKIELLTYGIISGFALDPVEKKPLYHYYPGMNIFSIGSYGCNMRCDFCQNFNISQSSIPPNARYMTPDEILKYSLSSHKNIGVAFTYNEPAIWYEYVKDVALKIKEAGQNTVMVTNGFVSSEALKEYLKFIDAFNVDLKAFNNDFYKRFTGASLEPVKESLKIIARSGRHLEITTLIIPGRNDSDKEMESEAEWIAGELGQEVPLHLSRYFPMYKRDDPPTPANTLIRLYEIAHKHLSYVYIGNVGNITGQNTYCPRCNNLITKREGYYITNSGTKNGLCSVCGKEIYKYFITFPSSR